MAEKILDIDNIEYISELSGSFDQNLKILENEFQVSILNREQGFKIVGEFEGIDNACKVMSRLLKILDMRQPITEQTIRYIITLVQDGEDDKLEDYGKDCVCITARGKAIKSKTLGQKKYINSIKTNTITFGIGPAGTGKTYLAVAMAVTALKAKQTERIILTRPAVEAGEKLGFLPGDLQTKVDPYLRPLYDALYDMLGMDVYQKYLERGIIEIAPLAYMRGRTLDDSFIILDEAQNTTPEQMKMFLTRIGFGSKVVVTGDITQIDLPFGKTSGLKEAARVLRNVEDIEFCYLTYKDVVRHVLVQRIIKAYEKHENN